MSAECAGRSPNLLSKQTTNERQIKSETHRFFWSVSVVLLSKKPGKLLRPNSTESVTTTWEICGISICGYSDTFLTGLICSRTLTSEQE